MRCLRRFTAAILFFTLSCSVHAQSRTDADRTPKPLRFDLTPLVGYRTNFHTPVRPVVEGAEGAEGTDARVVFDANPGYGVAFGIRLDEENIVEFRWARQNTRFHVEDPASAASSANRQQAILNQFHADFTHEYILENRDWVRPFITGSVGVTHVSGGDNNGFTRFSMGLGTGLKIFPERHVGFRFQAAWLPIWMSPDVAFSCGGGCVVRFGGELSSQGEFSAGPFFRF